MRINMWKKTVFLIILGISIFFNIFFFHINKLAIKLEEDYLDVKYQYELKLYRLVYGKWRIIGYMEDDGNDVKNVGVDEFSLEIEFNPKYLKVGEKLANGDLYIVCNLIPESQIGKFLGEQVNFEDIKSILKTPTADFYTVSKILTKKNNKKMEELKNQIPGGGKTIYIIDSDTIVMYGNNKFFFLKREGYIDGINEEELVEYMGEI